MCYNTLILKHHGHRDNTVHRHSEYRHMYYMEADKSHLTVLYLATLYVTTSA